MSNIKTFNVSFPAELADTMDRLAESQFGSRSDLLRYAVQKYIREEQELESLLAYGKQIGQTIEHQTEEGVARALTAKRRATEAWRAAT